MRVLVTGAAGQLGSELLPELRRRGDQVTGVDAGEVDVTDAEGVRALVSRVQPQAIIHCAAYTEVDKAETEPAYCCRVNAGGTLNVVRAAVEAGASVMYLSTAQVFSGAGDAPWSTDDRRSPKNMYGLSKLQGEEAVRGLMSSFYIVRTSWLCGANGRNLVTDLLRNEYGPLQFPGDRVGSPTFTADLAPLLCDMLHSGKYGIYHATNEGECSLAEFAGEVLRLSGRSGQVTPVPTAACDGLAKRPLNVRLSKESLTSAGFSRLPHWRQSLERLMNALR